MGTIRQGRNLDETFGGPPPLAEWRSQPIEGPAHPQPALDLRDETPHRAALELLRAAAPYEVAPGRQQRVRLALDRSTTTARRRRWLQQPAVIVSVLIGGAAVSRAALGPWPDWMTRAYDRLVPAASAPTADGAGALGSRPGRIARARSASSESLRLAAPAPAASTIAQPPVEPAQRTNPPATAHARQPATLFPPADDTALVLAAMRTLRREHDPVSARTLLATYLNRYPAGTLAEEALAMSIEAAVAHGDGDASLLARRYLRLYPNGPFKRLASQTVRQE